MTSILETTKRMLGIPSTYTHFDDELIIHINTAISILTQLGVGPSDGFSITSSTETWSDFVSDESKIKMIENYIFARVRLSFDPPASAAAIEALNKQMEMYEFRINLQVDRGETYAWNSDSDE